MPPLNVLSISFAYSVLSVPEVMDDGKTPASYNAWQYSPIGATGRYIDSLAGARMAFKLRKIWVILAVAVLDAQQILKQNIFWHVANQPAGKCACPSTVETWMPAISCLPFIPVIPSTT